MARALIIAGVLTATLCTGLARLSAADQAPDVMAMFYNEYVMQWPLERLGEALQRNKELADRPDVGTAVTTCFQPVKTSFHASVSAFFGQGNNDTVTASAENMARFLDSHKAWKGSVLEFVEYVRQLPVAVDIVVGPNGVTYGRQPDIMPLYAGVPLQVLIVTVRREGSDALPKFREETADLRVYRTIPIRTDGEGIDLIRLNVANLPAGTNAFPVTVMDKDGKPLAELPLTLTGQPSGRIKVEVIDTEIGQPTPARVGLYGPTGFVRPDTAVPLNVHDAVEYERTLWDPMWPCDDKRVFYTAGSIDMAVPPGEYRLVVRKGIERLLQDQVFNVKADETHSASIPMARFVNLPSQGWYSCDDHIHVRRDAASNASIMKMTQAEDIHVGNMAQMDDVNTLSFLQYAWGDQGMYQEGDYVLRSGQEGPRTDFLGHMLFFNLKDAIHDHDSYYIYQDVIDQAHVMGALAGYAHYGTAFGAEHGMTLDVAAKKVDFMEIVQTFAMNTDVYYHFLNLGYRLTPTAGSDYPFNPTAGESLVFAYVDGPFTFDKWYAGLKAGHTFVSGGPILEFSVDGQLPGSEIALAAPGRLRIRASARLNPSLDQLQRLEVVRFGETVKTVEAAGPAGQPTSVEFELDVDRSCWIAARAFGAKSQAHSAPVYVVVAGAPTWNTDKLQPELDRVEQQLAEIEEKLAKPGDDIVLQANASRLRHTIKAAREQYQGLKTQAGLLAPDQAPSEK